MCMKSGTCDGDTDVIVVVMVVVVAMIMVVVVIALLSNGDKDCKEVGGIDTVGQ